jgi:membrane-bound lytic murein transglycosylase D
MQYWLYLCKFAPQTAVFAFVSLLLTACSTTPQSTSTINQPISTTTAQATVAKKSLISNFFSASDEQNTPDDEQYDDYYNTTGLVASQDDIDELLGVTEMEAAALSPEDLAKFGDVWQRTRAGFKLEAIDNERIAAQRAWFAKHQSYLDRMTARASYYLYHTVTEAEKAGVPTELALLPIIESSYDPFATSPAQAAGLWQFIPGTGKIFGLRQTWWYDGRRDVLESTRAAYKFLTQLYNKFGSWELALAAYNWGPGNIQKAINRNLAAGLPTDYWSLRMPAETMAYVPRFLAVAQVIKNPEAFGVNLKPIVNQAHFRETYAKNQVDLAAVAKIAGLTTKQLYQLNPGYMRWATNPDGPHRVLVPLNTPEVFEELLASLPAPERFINVNKRYVVKKGDTLQRIAAKFDTTPAALKRLNGKLISKKGRVAVGKSLVVARVKTLVSGETVAVEQLVNPAAERIALLEKADKEETQAKEKSAKTTSKAAKSKDKAETTAKSFHKVRSGDTLHSIAKKYDVSVKQLAEWNDLKSKAALKTGKKLVVAQDDDAESPRVAKNSKKSKAKAEDNDSPKNSNKKDKRVAKNKERSKADKERVKRISYEVKRGDTLYSISQRYKVSVSQLKTWNKATKNLKPGQDLVLYLAKS